MSDPDRLTASDIEDFSCHWTEEFVNAKDYDALAAQVETLREVIEHVIRYGQVGKQSERRLRAALKGDS